MRKLAVFAAAAAAAVTACSSGVPSVSVHTPPPLPSARQVAAALGYSRFTGCGHPKLLVVEAATAWKGGVKYGIDTFASPVVRDRWEKAAANLGVVPVRYGRTWVAYRAGSQKAGCS